MPVSYEFRGDAVIIRSSGEYNYKEGIDAVSKVIGRAEFRAGMRVLFDTRGTSGAPTWQQIHQYMSHYVEWSRWIKHIAVLVDNIFHYGVSRQFALHAKRWGLSVDVFREPKDAERWLCGGSP